MTINSLGALQVQMETDIVKIEKLKEKLKRAEYIRLQQLQLIQKLQTINTNYAEQIKTFVHEKYKNER